MKRHALATLLVVLVLAATIVPPAAAARRPNNKNRPPRPNNRRPAVASSRNGKIDICKYDPDTKAWKQLSVSSSAWKDDIAQGKFPETCTLDSSGPRPCNVPDCANPWQCVMSDWKTADDATKCLETRTIEKAPKFSAEPCPTTTTRVPPSKCGLTAQFYELPGTVEPDCPTTMPVLAMLPPAYKTTTVQAIDVPTVQNGFPDAGRGDFFAVSYMGYIQLAKDGDYTFFLFSDDGSKLWIDGTLVVNNEGLHSPREVSATASLKAGRREVRVEYFECTGVEALQLSWQGPDISEKQVIPAERWFLAAT